MLIQIKEYKTSHVIFESDYENNTIKDTVEEAVRQGVDLSGADLGCATLKGADLHGAKLDRANLSLTNLRDADLRDADLYAANLEDSYLSGADLTGANIRDAWLDNVTLGNTTKIDFPMACPEKGSFVAWKKISNTKEYGINRRFIVKLEIPEDAKRSSATSNKCRCSKAKVIEIRDIKSDETIDEITNISFTPCTYKVGEYVYPNFFDECRWNECSNGIHFFMSEREAINYF